MEFYGDDNVNENFVNSLVGQLPLSYAYHRIVTDENGVPTDYIFLDVNEAFEKMTGLQKQNIIGRRVTETLHGIRNEEFDWVDFYGKVALSREAKEITRYSDALKRWYKVSAYSPETGYFVTIFQDVSSEMDRIKLLEQQKTELEKLSDDIRIIFNCTHDAMFLIKYKNDEFRYITTNAQHQSTTGFQLEEIQGKTPFELFGVETGQIIHNNYLRCVKEEESISYEETRAYPSGVKTWFTSLTPVYENGIIAYLTGSMKDITKRKIVEKEKDELLNKLDSMFSNHSAIMLIIEPESGKIIDANPAASKFYGYSRDELLNMYIQDINILPAEEVKRLRLQAFSHNQRYFIMPHRLKNGQVRMVDVYSSPLSHSGKSNLYSIIFDVTDREKYKQDLLLEKQLLNTTLRSIGDGVVTTDVAGRITSLNKSAQEITGWSDQDAQNHDFTEVFDLTSEETQEKVESPIEKVLETGEIIGLANHTVLMNKQGNLIPVADSAAPIKDDNGKTYGVVMVFRDVSKEKESKNKIYQFSYHDHLTGLYNRRFMDEKIDQFNCSDQYPIAVIMGDVNGLKITNDVFGHVKGDELLQKVATILSEVCSKDCFVGRWGGDEFLILIPDSDSESTEQIIQKAKVLCEKKSGADLQLSVSFGYATKKSDKEDLRVALQQAEEMMYHGKLMESRSYHNQIVNNLISMLDEKSLETEEHAQRMKLSCTLIGKKLNMPANEISELSLLAILHDIGKVGIPENILQKPGPLTVDEMDIMKKHTEIGYRIAQNSTELSSISELILFHHERWDGNGYPSGLKGEDIPLKCRILAIADAYDAMTNDRVYRKAMTKSEAVNELILNKNTQFDPYITDVFIDALKKPQKRGQE